MLQQLVRQPSRLPQRDRPALRKQAHAAFVDVPAELHTNADTARCARALHAAVGAQSEGHRLRLGDAYKVLVVAEDCVGVQGAGVEGVAEALHDSNVRGVVPAGACAEGGS